MLLRGNFYFLTFEMNHVNLSALSYNNINPDFIAGKKAKSPIVAIDHDLADGLVDLEKLKASMQKTVGSLQLEFKDKLSVNIQPSKYQESAEMF